MSYTYYQALGLIPASTSWTFNDIAHAIQQHFTVGEHTQLIAEGQRLLVQINSWTIYITWSTGPSVSEDAAQMANEFLARGTLSGKPIPDREAIVSCNRMV